MKEQLKQNDILVRSNFGNDIEFFRVIGFSKNGNTVRLKWMPSLTHHFDFNHHHQTHMTSHEPFIGELIDETHSRRLSYVEDGKQYIIEKLYDALEHSRDWIASKRSFDWTWSIWDGSPIITEYIPA